LTGAIDQAAGSTDLLSDPPLTRRLSTLYDAGPAGAKPDDRKPVA
jgi:hypothetical protein